MIFSPNNKVFYMQVNCIWTENPCYTIQVFPRSQGIYTIQTNSNMITPNDFNHFGQLTCLEAIMVFDAENNAFTPENRSKILDNINYGRKSGSVIAVVNYEPYQW